MLESCAILGSAPQMQSRKSRHFLLLRSFIPLRFKFDYFKIDPLLHGGVETHLRLFILIWSQLCCSYLFTRSVLEQLAWIHQYSRSQAIQQWEQPLAALLLATQECQQSTPEGDGAGPPTLPESTLSLTYFQRP